MSTTDDVVKPLKTWSHLAKNKRRPTEYEIVSTNTLWHTPNRKIKWSQGDKTPVGQWRTKYRDESPLKHDDWDAFRDPDRMIYRTYNLVQDGQETYVDGLIEEHANNEHDLGLTGPWLDTLEKAYTPARYLVHGTQMALGYQVSIAPCSTVANALMFEAADQLRWLSRIAYRTAELAKNHPDRGFNKTERASWEDADMWQGFLELTERSLVTWDWGESFIVVHLVLKPAIDEAFMHQFGAVARENGDVLTGMLLDAQFTDSERSRRFAGALVNFLCEDDTHGNRETITSWLEKWNPLGEKAIEDFCAGLGGAEYAEAAKKEMKAFQASLDLG